MQRTTPATVVAPRLPGVSIPTAIPGEYHYLLGMVRRARLAVKLTYLALIRILLSSLVKVSTPPAPTRPSWSLKLADAMTAVVGPNSPNAAASAHSGGFAAAA